ncbi:hypothetical protein CL634_02130 [bacterium]|nr:hypothetical protein [bacterium]
MSKDYFDDNQVSLERVKQEYERIGITQDANKLALIQEGTYTTVEVSFLKDARNRKYTYKLHNSMKDKAVVGGHAIVDTDSGYKAVVIRTVHEQSQLDYNAMHAWKWVVAIVDDAWYTAQVEKERIALYEMSQAEARAKLEQSISGDLNELKSRWGF